MRHQQSYASISEAWGDHFVTKARPTPHPNHVVAAEPTASLGAPAQLDDADDPGREATMRAAMHVEPAVVRSYVEAKGEKCGGDEKADAHDGPAKKSKGGGREDFVEGDIDRRYTQYMEFAVYIFSGIVLMFMMEQFIQIGVALRSKS
jgi:hypothetical protein